MFQTITTHFGQWLSIVGAALTTSFQGGAPVATEGLSELEATVLATFDASSSFTTMDFQIQVSDDLTNWDGIESMQIGQNTPAVTQSITTSAGNTVRVRLQLTNAALQTFRMAKYTRIAAKFTGGATHAGDSAVSTLNYNGY